MDKQLNVGDWMWHTNAMCVVRVTGIGEQGERIDGAKDQMVSVTFSSFQHGACTHVHSYVDNGLSYDTFASCLIPLEQAPCYVSELLQDWVDAIEIDKARQAIIINAPVFSVGDTVIEKNFGYVGEVVSVSGKVVTVRFIVEGSPLRTVDADATPETLDKVSPSDWDSIDTSIED